MGLSCSACGFKSENHAFFRREKTPSFGIARWFCLGCKPLPPAKAGWVKLLVFAGVMALGAWLILTPHSYDTAFGYWILVFGGFVTLSPITILIHEAGHAVAAVAVGRRVYRVNIGTGAPLRTIRLRQTDIVIGRDQRGGYVMCLPKASESRWREALMVAAGPAANFGAMVAFGGLAGALYGTGHSPWGTVGSVVAGSLTVSNAFMGVFALVPMYNRLEGVPWASDGRRLLQLLRRRREAPDWQIHHDDFEGARLVDAKRWPEAEAHYRRIVSVYPDQPGFLAMLLHVLSLAEGPAAAMACAVEHAAFLRREEPAAEPRTASLWAAAWGNAAWAILRSANGDLALADELSVRAAEADTTSPYPRAVRAAVLTRSGQRAEGLAVIVANLRDMVATSDKLEFCAFIVGEGLETADLSRSDFESYAAHLRALA